jgi:hypothetical protein
MAKYQLFGTGKTDQQEIRRRCVGSTVRSKRSKFRIFFCKLLHHMKKFLSMLCCNARCQLYGPRLLTLKNLQFSKK